MKVKVQKLYDMAIIPEYQTEGSAALDLHACSYGEWTDLVIPPNSRKLVKSGLAFAVPQGYMAIVSPRSGSALKAGITITNSPGIIDSDYRGDIGTIIQNDGLVNFKISDGDRVSQLTFVPILRVELEEADELDDTERGADGFGSTGV